MVEKEYVINWKIYTTKTEYIKEDNLHEVSLVSRDGEVWLATYGETKGEAYREMEERLSDRGILPGVPNMYTPWESLSSEIRRKIQVYLRGLKRELMGEWMTEEERYQKFRKMALSWTTKTYGYITPPSKSEYNRL